jgi:hypothetical protein
LDDDEEILLLLRLRLRLLMRKVPIHADEETIVLKQMMDSYLPYSDCLLAMPPCVMLKGILTLYVCVSSRYNRCPRLARRHTVEEDDVLLVPCC